MSDLKPKAPLEEESAQYGSGGYESADKSPQPAPNPDKEIAEYGGEGTQLPE